MFNKPLIISIVIGIALFAIPVGYQIRWEYCDYNYVGWCQIGPFNASLSFKELSPADQVVVDEWFTACSKLYRRSADSWIHLPPEEHLSTRERSWQEYYTQMDESKLDTSGPFVFGSRHHVIRPLADGCLLDAVCNSRDGKTRCQLILSGPDQLETLRYFPDTTNGGIMPFELSSLYHWSDNSFYFDKTFYHFYVVTSEETSTWSGHAFRFKDKETFLRTCFESLDKLEVQIEQYLQSDAPASNCIRYVHEVDVCACEKRLVAKPASRPLSSDERRAVQRKARDHVNGLRDRVHAYGEAWFLSLEKLVSPNGV